MLTPESFTSRARRRSGSAPRICSGVMFASALVLGACDKSATEPEVPKQPFVVQPQNMTLSVMRVGSGTVTSSPSGLTCSANSCNGVFAVGTTVSLQAVPAPGSRFSGWTGVCTGTNVCTVTMDAARNGTLTFVSKVDANGLTPEINAFVPDTLVKIMTAMGLRINRGATPPSLAGTFRMSPAYLQASTLRGDPLGYITTDYFLRLRDQDNDRLSLLLDYSSGPEQGTGIGSFVVGTDTSFTIFSRIVTVNARDTAINVQVLSGRLTTNGIVGLQTAAFMVDNRGNNVAYIPNNTGRLWVDRDAFSERVGDLRSSVAMHLEKFDTATPPGTLGANLNLFRQ